MEDTDIVSSEQHTEEKPTVEEGIETPDENMPEEQEVVEEKTEIKVHIFVSIIQKI